MNNKMKIRFLENVDSFIVSVTAAMTIPLASAYHFAFRHSGYTLLMVLVCLAVGIHMLGPFTSQRYKRIFDLVFLADIISLVALGANSHFNFL